MGFLVYTLVYIVALKFCTQYKVHHSVILMHAITGSYINSFQQQQSQISAIKIICITYLDIFLSSYT